MRDPLRSDAEGPPGWHQRHLRQPLEASGRSRTKVLVVGGGDDERRVLAHALRLYGYAVCEASTSHAALADLERERFDIVVADFSMPDMDGLAFLKTARQHGHGTAASIVMVGPTTWDPIVEAMKLGAADYLPKPFHPELLRLVMARTAEKRELIARARQADLYEKLAHTDELTGLYNYRFFHQLLDVELSRARRFQRPFSLIMLDVDHFKSFNDLNGHQAGDRALRQLARCLKLSSRSYDLVARYGGDEFAIILPETTKSTAAEVGERIRAKIAGTPIGGAGMTLAGCLTASFGIASFPDDAPDATALIRKSDDALYHAKAHGRNRLWHFASTSN